MYKLGKRFKTSFILLSVDIWFERGVEEVVLTIENTFRKKEMKISFLRAAPLNLRI